MLMFDMSLGIVSKFEMLTKSTTVPSDFLVFAVIKFVVPKYFSFETNDALNVSCCTLLFFV